MNRRLSSTTYSNNLKLPKVLCSKRKVILILTVILAAGSLSGSLFGSLQNYHVLKIYIENLSNFYALTQVNLFLLLSYFSYAVFVITMWTLAFTPLFYINFLIVFFRGAAIGFVTISLIIVYGFMGILYSFLLFIPQNILLLFTYYYVNISVFRFINKRQLSDHLISLLFSLVLILLISIYESFILPLVLTWAM